ncbi:unnamed protein product [Brassica napus]|uniref:(rape) hypothetical protein n=1 Tax=Brassica napus TaxID=3708 RepID=A0A816S0J7_BRANA|nr:unnamed protein product [Brassica napus]
MFELWFREMEATTDPSSPAFLRGVEAPSAPPTRFKFGKESYLDLPSPGLVTECGCFHRSAADEKPKLLGQGYYCSFSAKLEGGGVLVLMMKLSAEVKSVKSTIRWFSMRVRLGF